MSKNIRNNKLTSTNFRYIRRFLKLKNGIKKKVLEIFKELNFKRYIDRFNLLENNKGTENQEKRII